MAVWLIIRQFNSENAYWSLNDVRTFGGEYEVLVVWLKSLTIMRKWSAGYGVIFG